MAAALLCSRCMQLPFRDLFWTASYGGAIGAVTQGHSGPYYQGVQCFASFSEFWNEDKCAFCAFLRNAFETFYTVEVLEELVCHGDEAGLYLFQDPLDVGLDRLAEVELDIPLSLFVIVARGFKEKHPPVWSQSLPTSDIKLAPQLIALRDNASSAVAPFPQFGREVEVDTIDWSVVQRWISCCLEHSNEGVMSSSDNTGKLRLRVVDVIDGCVVELPHKAQYVALSYVWGSDQRVKLRTDNLPQLSSPGYLQSPFGRPSKTIVDATRVVRSLGYRYLWVDALCIIQDDFTNLEQNIMQMDSVYSQALFTIAATAGVGANHGLPGVSPEVPRTQNQHRITIDGLKIANRLQSDINSTWWNTRGWTYQERVLPSRILFFSDVQVEYRCEGDCNFQEQFHNAYGQASFSLFDSISHLDFADTNLFTLYAKAVTEYTRRSITDPMDRLKAFQGILGRLKAPLQAPFLFGLPLLLFDVGLLWYPAGSLTRIDKTFPSWSWAGWNGPVQWHRNGDEDLVNFCESTVSICTICYGKPPLRLCTDVTSHSDEPLSPIWERRFDAETNEIYYTSQMSSYKGYRYPRPLDSAPAVLYDNITNSKSVVLEIQAKIAVLRLTGQHYGTTIETTCNLGVHEICTLVVLDDSNRVTGTVTVEGRLVPQLQGRTHRFLGLSRSTYIRAGLDEETEVEYIEPTWDREKKRFRPWDSLCTEPERGEGDRVFGDYRKLLENWIAEECSGPGDTVKSPPFPKSPEYGERLQQYFSFGESNWETNEDHFDKKEFSDRTPWPRVNVLLLSQETDGLVERIGCGEIHVDAFMPIAKVSTVFLK